MLGFMSFPGTVRKESQNNPEVLKAFLDLLDNYPNSGYVFRSESALYSWRNICLPAIREHNRVLCQRTPIKDNCSVLPPVGNAGAEKDNLTTDNPNQQAVNTTSSQCAAAAYMPKQTRNAFHNYNQQRNDGTDELYKNLPYG